MTSAEPRTEATDAAHGPDITDVTEEESPVTAESLIEEVSIDGMCGVY
ncbi:MAG: mycofactocin precursor MftA [Actinomycetota bacterium]